MAHKFVVPISIRHLASASSQGIAISVDGDTNDRVVVEAGGRIVWGSGSTSGDTNLYRDSPNTLKTDDAFIASSLGVADAFTLPVVDGSDGQLLQTNGAGSVSWVDNDLSALSDFEITNATNGDLLIYDGTNWVNDTLPSSEPMGHEDRTKSAISFDSGSLTFTIEPVGESHTVWCVGHRYIKTSAETVTIPNTPGLYYISYDSTGSLQYEQTYFTWHQDTPTAYVYWSGTDYLLFDERHGIVLDWQTHEYLHRTRGAVLANGFGVSNYTTNGTGDLDSEAQLDIADGTFFDEDLQVDIVHSATPTANSWEQVLQGGAELPIIYLSGTTWTFDAPTAFPLKQGAALPKYNLNTSGTWSTPDLGNGSFGVTWIVATNILTSPVIGILGQDEYNNIGQAEAADWSSQNLEGFPVVELRPLYKVVYEVKSSYTNTPGAAIRGVYDLRRYGSVAGQIPALPVADHGSLTGLSDDDHTQYPKLTNSDTAPSSPRQNDMWYDTTNGRTYVYYDSYWVEMGSGSGEIFLDNISDVNAGSPSDGDILFYSSESGFWEAASQNSRIDPRDGYAISNTDNAIEYKYFGFQNVNDAWYIARKTSEINVVQYAKGDTNYALAWSNRVSHTYASFAETFA